MRVLGHPVHPMLIVFPIGLLVTGTVFDAIDVFGGSAEFGRVGFWNIAAGLIGVVLAAGTGLLDWLRVPAGTRAKRIGRVHAGLNSAMAVLFLISWLVRLNADTREPSAALLILEIVAVAVLGVSGWLGGELVDRLGVGVDAGAHADSPSSLSHRPASERVSGQDRRDRGRAAHA